MIKKIKLCKKYSHLIPALETLSTGSILELLEWKLALELANKPADDASTDEIEHYAGLILLNNELKNYKSLMKENAADSKEEIDNASIEIAKLILNLI